MILRTLQIDLSEDPVHKVYGRIKEGLKNFEHSEFVMVLKDTHIKLDAKVPSERQFSNE
jgi:hypothetical protein